MWRSALMWRGCDMDEVTQVIRPAKGAPPVATTGVRSAFDIAKDLSTAKRDHRPSPQYLVVKALADIGGVVSHDVLHDLMSAHMDGKALSNAVYHAKKEQRLRKLGKGFEVTEIGRTFIASSYATQEREDKFSRKPKALSAKQVDIPTASAGLSGVRWAVWSDGQFVIQRGANSIELAPTEFASLRAAIGAAA
jgi:hypothetical protein